MGFHGFHVPNGKKATGTAMSGIAAVKSALFATMIFSPFGITTTLAASTLAVAATATGIPQEGLVAYYPFTSGNLANMANTENAGAEIESAANASSENAPQAAMNKGATFGPDRFGNENSAAVFSGDSNSYMEIPDHDAFSINTAGALTISVWVCPKVLTFRNAESSGYVHWMGKGVPQQHEWVFRMYNKELTESQENRPNRMSAYAFNLKGGLGSGSYVQEELTPGEWMHIVARYDIATNTITLFKNGVQKDQDALYDETYGVQVENGTAPVRLGTRSLWSFFEGSIDDLRFYGRALADEEILSLYNEPNPAAKSDTIAADTVKTDTTAKDTATTRAPGNPRSLENSPSQNRARAIREPYGILFAAEGEQFDARGRKK